VAGAFGLIVVMAGLDLVGPWLTKLAIDRHVATGDADGLGRLALALPAHADPGLRVRFGQVFILQMTGQRVMKDMRREIFGHLQKLHLSYFDRNPVGRLMTRVTRTSTP
jgi:ATP-binding cassette subfamily B protein